MTDTKQYETIVAFDQGINESTVKSESKRIQGVISAHGGTGVEVHFWGKKDFPHISNRSAPGYYVCFEYAGAVPTLVGDLEGILRITDSVSKFQTHRTNLKARKFKGNPKAKTFVSDEDFGDIGDLEY